MPGYDFKTTEFRAQCLSAYDGDSPTLVIDCGFHQMFRERFRMSGIDTYEINDKDPEKKALAVRGRDQLVAWLKPVGDGKTINLQNWPLRVKIFKAPEKYGRWLAEIYVKDDQGVEFCVNQALVSLGLAKPFMVKP